jgi:hypothetical protein
VCNEVTDIASLYLFAMAWQCILTRCTYIVGAVVEVEILLMTSLIFYFAAD